MLQEKHAAPTVTDLEALIERISLRVGRHLERRGLLERDAENAYLEWDAEQASSLDDLAGHAITYRIAVGPNWGQKAFTLQTLPAVETDPARPALVARAGRFSLHAGVAARCGPTRPQAALGKTKGASSEAGVPHTPGHPLLMLRINSPCRHRVVRALRRGGLDHRQHRRPRRHPEDTRAHRTTGCCTLKVEQRACAAGFTQRPIGLSDYPSQGRAVS